MHYGWARAQHGMEHRSRLGVAATAALTPTGSRDSVVLLAELARSLEGRLDDLADRLLTEIRGHEPDPYRRSVPSVDLDGSVHDNLGEALAAIAQLPSGVMPPPRAAQRTGQRRAEQGLPLESLLHAYRLGGRVIWEALLEEARRLPHSPMDGLMDAAVHVWDVIDFHSDAVATAYRRAEGERAGRDEMRREAALRALLAGVAGESDLQFAANVLSLPESGPYVVAIAYDEGDRGEALAALIAAAGNRSQWLRRELRLVGLIAGHHLTSAALRGSLLAAGRRIGLSAPVADLGMIAAAYRQAELALRAIPADQPDVSSLDDHLTGALLVASPDLGRRLRRRTLGPVLDLPSAERTVLLRTLRTYLEMRGSVAAAAARIPCHRNTVLNRVHRFQDLTGVSLTDPRAVAQVVLALEAGDVLRLDSSDEHAEPAASST